MKFSRFEGIDETIEWLDAEYKKDYRANNFQSTPAGLHLKNAVCSLQALDSVLDRAELFANQAYRKVAAIKRLVEKHRYSGLAQEVLAIINDKAH